MSFNLPNPCLVGILLVISTHSGPQLVYRYPPNLSSEVFQRKRLGKIVPNHDMNSSDDDFEDDDEEYESAHSSDDQDLDFDADSAWDSNHLDYYMGTKKDILLFLDDQERLRNLNKTKPAELGEDNLLKKTLSGVSHRSTSTKNSKLTPKAIPNDILGFEPSYLSEILSPPKQMCNSRFEITIEDKVFLGLPLHSYDGGSWRTKKSRRSKSNRSQLSKAKSGNSLDDLNEDVNDADEKNDKHSMNMFHVVFIMNPPTTECNYRIDEMFLYVISRLSLVLRYEQLKHDYVWNQVELISKLKLDWKVHAPNLSLNDYLVQKSTLSKLIADCYLAISSSEIANLSINNKIRSFQIPIKTEFHSLPEATVPFLPSSHLSSTVSMLANTGLINVGETTRYGTTNMMTMLMMGAENVNVQNEDDETEEKSNADDIVYFALLLLDDPEAIITDIKAEPSSALAEFIRSIKPTESLLKLANKLKQKETKGLDIAAVKSFAFHLIYWRRARVIPPLSTRSVYIVSPMAPIEINLYNDIVKFKETFTTLPSLPHFLKLLSIRLRKPRQFATIIPSKDHRDSYLAALSWLIRFGYVTQLHTFIWLKISRKIKMKVEEDLEIESSRISKHKRESDALEKEPKLIRATDNTSKQESSSKKPVPLTSSFDEDIDILEKGIKAMKHGPDIMLEEDNDTIIIDPGRATTLERKWINKIIVEECNLSPELTAVFYKLLKYMNGKNSLELLLLKENVSRHDLRKLLFAIEQHIISVRHW